MDVSTRDPVRLGLVGAGLGLVTIFGVAAITSDPGDVAPATAAEQPSEESGGDAVPTGPEPGDSIAPGTFAAQLGMATLPAGTGDLTVTLDVAGQSVDVDAEVDFSAQPAISRMTIPVVGREAEVITSGSDVYANLGGLSGDRYLHLDLADLPGPLQELPTEQLSVVTGIGGIVATADDVTYAGPDEVDDVTLDRYELRTDSERLQSLHDKPGLGGIPETLESTVWLAEDGTVQRVETDLGSAGDVTAVAHSWGQPVHIEEPSGDQLVSRPSLPELPDWNDVRDSLPF